MLIPELFEGPYFCKDMRPEHFDRARPLDGHPTVERFQKVAAELEVVLPLSVYERANQATYNSVVVVDADGSVLGTYRKSHIPDGPGYTEKYYFNPGDTGFRVWRTRYGMIGVGICWDQWFPETARSMALLGAELLFFPTAIGSEPPDPAWDSAGHWQRVMQGHAAANLMPLVAANRVGHEVGQTTEITFYGSSFIADFTGAMVATPPAQGRRCSPPRSICAELARQRSAWACSATAAPTLLRPGADASTAASDGSGSVMPNRRNGQVGRPPIRG